MPRKGSNRNPESKSYDAETRAAIAASQQIKAYPHNYARPDASVPLDHLDALVGQMLFDEGIQFRLTPDREGVIWAKACIRTSAYPRHYLLASFPPGTPFTACIEGLLRKVSAFQKGELKPSPDKW